MTYTVNEIFTSIQGEGIHSGLVTTFIRFSGCNLRCQWCDTPYALDANDGRKMDLLAIMDEVLRSDAPYVCITGGEPLMQKDIDILISTLLEHGKRVDVETNGSLDISKVQRSNPDLMISMDVKPPSSKEVASFHPENIFHLKKKDQLKFIIDTEDDLEYALEFLKKYSPPSNIIFTPCGQRDSVFIAEALTGSAKDRISTDLLKRTRLMVQTHKVVWKPEQRGV